MSYAPATTQGKKPSTLSGKSSAANKLKELIREKSGSYPPFEKTGECENFYLQANLDGAIGEHSYPIMREIGGFLATGARQTNVDSATGKRPFLSKSSATQYFSGIKSTLQGWFPSNAAWKDHRHQYGDWQPGRLSQH